MANSLKIVASKSYSIFRMSLQSKLNELKIKIVAGGTNYLSSYVLPKVINQFNRLYPDVEVELAEANSYNLGRTINNEQYIRNLYIAHRKNRYCTKAMAEFIRITKGMLGDGIK